MSADAVSYLVADITVGQRNRWRWWADVRVRPAGWPPDPSIATSTSGVVVHDVHGWSETAVRGKAERKARKEMERKIDRPYQYSIASTPCDEVKR